MNTTATALTDRLSLGERLSRVRRRAKISQPAMAKRLGYSESTISNYERDIHHPPFEIVSRWAVECDAPIGYLLAAIVSEDEARKITDTTWSRDSDYHVERSNPRHEQMTFDLTAGQLDLTAAAQAQPVAPGRACRSDYRSKVSDALASAA